MSIETDLRAALHERAAPIHATSDLLAIDYHPRTRRLRPPVAIGGGLATIAAGGIATALLLTSGASSAFAGWTPQPTAPTSAQLAAAETECAKNVPTPGLPLELTDTRGPFTFEVYANDTANDFCITGPAFSNASGFSTATPVAVPAGNLYLWSEQTTTHAGEPYGFVIARAGDEVSAATLTLDDGTEVTATVQNGWAVAWWPGTHQVAGAQLMTPTGTQTQTFPQSACGLHYCGSDGAPTAARRAAVLAAARGTSHRRPSSTCIRCLRPGGAAAYPSAAVSAGRQKQPVVVKRVGRGPEVLLIHGGASPQTTWRGLDPLRARWTLATVYRRGFAPSPPPTSGHQDFDEDAADILSLLERRPHIVAHSYGSVGAMLAAGGASRRVRSLTLIEPPVHLVHDDPEAEHLKQIGEAFLVGGPDTDPELMREFLQIAGSPLADHGPLPDNVIAAARRAQGTRSPYAASLPLRALRESRIPILVVSGAHCAPIERNMDALACALGARRMVAPGAGHFVTAAVGFAERLDAFLNQPGAGSPVAPSGPSAATPSDDS